MSFYGLRFDLRNPDIAGTTMAERYAAAIDMAEWADQHGFVIIVLSEHHGSDDGYLPSPLTMAAAMAARTQHARIQISALIAPFHDPLRLAEDIAVVDLVSNGRLDVVIANGYVPGEFEMFGRNVSDRVKLTVETVRTLKQAWTGEPFEFRGRTVRVLPTPAQPGGPKITLGGSGPKAAKRAAHIADGFMPSDGSIWETYRAEMLALGQGRPRSLPRRRHRARSTSRSTGSRDGRSTRRSPCTRSTPTAHGWRQPASGPRAATRRPRMPARCAPPVSTES